MVQMHSPRPFFSTPRTKSLSTTSIWAVFQRASDKALTLIGSGRAKLPRGRRYWQSK
jgi:hypothetical protein